MERAYHLSPNEALEAYPPAPPPKKFGTLSRPFISTDSQLPSRKSFELISSKFPLPLPSWNVFELER